MTDADAADIRHDDAATDAVAAAERAELIRLDADLAAAAAHAERAYRDWVSADSAFQTSLRNRQPVADRLRVNATRAAAGPTPPDQLGAASPSLATAADANELEQIDQRLAGLAATATQAYEACRVADGGYRAILPQRELVASRLGAGSSTTAWPPTALPPTAGPPPPLAPPPVPPRPQPPGRRPTPEGPETSGHTVQNVLFVLGGLLLGSAAIVFTAVAWATFGDTGRAAVLAIVTAMFLAVPPLALRRGLRATAETFAGIGLLLVVLDGYAAWYVNLFHAKDLPGQRYVALVCTITAAFGLGYRRLTRLGAPVIASLIAIQPAAPLWVTSAYRLEPSGWALVYTALAAINLATVVFWRRPSLTLFAPGFATAVRGLAWVAFTAALAAASDWALIAEAVARSAPDVAVAGGVVILVVATLTSAAASTRSTSFHAIAGCALVLAFLAALVRLIGVAQPEQALWIDATAVALTALLVALVTAPMRRSGWNPGGPLGLNTGVAIALATLWTVLGVLALVTAARTAAAAQPAWRADLGRITAPDAQLLVSILVASLAAAIRLWPYRSAVFAVGASTAVFALPGALALPWWALSTLDFSAVTAIVAAGLLGAGILGANDVDSSATARPATPGGRPAVVFAVSAGASAALLTAHAIVTSLARPELTAAVLASISVVGVACGVAARWLPAAVNRLAWAGGAFAVGLLTAAPALRSFAAAVNQPAWWQARLTMVGLAVAALLFALLRSSPGAVLWYGYVAVLVGALMWPTVVRLGDLELADTYAGFGLVVVASALVALPHQLRGSMTGAAESLAGVAATPAAILAATSAVPVITVITLAPYFWLASIWTGPPAGVGLAPDSSNLIDISYVDSVTLALIGVAAAIVGYALTRRTSSIVTGLGVGIPAAALVAFAAAGPRWPGVAVATLGLGLGLTVLAGVRRLRPGLTVVAAGQGCAYVLAGLAGMLPTQLATVAGLGATTVAAAIVVAVGRSIGARACAAIVAVASALTTAAAAGAAADLRREQVAFAMLAVAALALAAGVALSQRRRTESLAIQASAHAAAVVSVLFTIPTLSSMAIACTAWGVVVGLHALWPGTARTVRIGRAAQAAGWELLAWWLLLADNHETTVEWYTLPLAGVGLLAGWAALRARPELRSWLAYGPALAAALLPSLAIVLAATPRGGSGEPMRRLLLGVGCLAAVIAGSVRRRQAPVVIGGVGLVTLALHEVVLYWDLVPRWIPLAAGGAILIAFAITYERRRRDMTRLRAAIGRMT